MINTEYICDKCGKKETFEGPQFKAKTPAKEAGWKTIKLGDGWENRCAECGGKK